VKTVSLLPWALVLVAATAASCAAGNNKLFGEGSGGTDDEGPTTTTTTAHGGAGGAGGKAQGGAGGAGLGGAAADAGADAAVGGPCATAVDCVSLSDQCNRGSCENGVCARQPANEFGACDDGLFCTDNEACTNGVCAGGTPKVCPAGDGCHIGVCDEASKSCTVVAGNDGNSCSDGDPCTAIAACQGGTCVQQTKKDCSFLDQTCATGTCDPQKGCVAVPNKDGTKCDDGLYCTVNDVCKGGVCGGQPNTCAAPGDVCMIGTCDEGKKECVAVPGNDGAKCQSGNTCLASETCSAGKCQGGAPANEGKACVSNDKCLVGTTCAGGVCGNAQSVISQCIDGDGCCPPGCANDSDCCGNDCWGPNGCKTDAGHCIRITCRAGTDGPTFCDKCMGWQEVTYADWMNGGWCGDVIAKYRAVEGTNTHCGNAPICCGDPNGCGGGDNAWHFWDGQSTRYTGPCLGCAGDTNCKFWDGVEPSNYTRLTVCKRY
jgi:hypothetical protein